MARSINRLSAITVAKTRRKGWYCDGGGLYLQVAGNAAKSWVFRFSEDGRTRYMGLGSLNTVGLVEAREKALECRRLRLNGIDPIEHRKANIAERQLAAAKALTFDACAERYIASHKAGWKDPRQHALWTATLKYYASPVFGSLSVQAVDTTLVMKALEPIWTIKPDTANRVRGRIEQILDWATVSGLRQGENPARWKGHLAQLLPHRNRLRAVQHHAALPYSEIAEFMVGLRKREHIADRALEFLVLTTTRKGEGTSARWDDIDLEHATWTIPATQMKGRRGEEREFRVPLSDAAVDVLRRVKELVGKDGLVFPGETGEAPLGRRTLDRHLIFAGSPDRNFDSRFYAADGRKPTVHGFRSTFRDWAAETTDFPNHVVEMALAHSVGNRVEAAYRRGDLFEKRRELMDAWADYCAGQTKAAGNVVRFGKG